MLFAQIHANVRKKPHQDPLLKERKFPFSLRRRD